MDFATFLDSSSLLPLPSKGNKFNWSNSRERGNVAAVLDRSFCNSAWLDLYNDAYQRVLPRSVSDHLLLVVFSDLVPKPVNCPFRLHRFWLEHYDFAAVVSQSWVEYVSGFPFFVVTQKLKRLKAILRIWSRSAFPNVNLEVDRARTALEDAQEVVKNVGCSEYLIQCESQAKQEYINAIKLEEKLWLEKSRNRALTCGDRNTRFFYLATKIRRSKNFIRVLKKADGNLINDASQISNYITDFYESFHRRANSDAHPEILSCIPSVILPDDNAFLTTVPSKKEIKAAVFDLDPDSAPGPDGFPDVFFRCCWNIIERDVCRVISNFFREGIITKGVNSNFITLIPKIEGAVTLDKFRPICLGHFLYKLIPKIVTTQLSGILPKLISEEQGVFQKGKVIFSNICVASEITNSLHVKSHGGRHGS
ncbi:uncharacterized protein LOC122665645 [Telopea speciosissima]|uniref:uncharacterized protein LOC122665645 n=1 Tax=Telopea speciosissima TaxID=54955 RepID=UPI001CC6F135|nr:uncharacterized protein LOC122665645 [Telopea speciosissima]